MRRSQFAQDGVVDLVRKYRLTIAATFVFALVTITAPQESAAQRRDPEAQLDYVAAPGCPTAADFEAVVVGRLGYSPFRPDTSERVFIRIEVSGPALEGRLEWRNAAGLRVGERTFPSRSRDCGELVRAMGFALALQVQLMAAAAAPAGTPPVGTPSAVVQTPPVGVVSPPVKATPPPPGADNPPEDPTSPGPDSGASIAVGVGASAGVGLSPEVAGLGRLFATVAWSRVAVELTAEMSAPSALHRADGMGFSERLVLAGLAGCGLRTRWSACLVAKAGEIRVVGTGVDLPKTSTGILLQTGLRLAVSQELGSRAYIVAHAAGLALLTRGVVTLDAKPVWEMPRFAATIGIDVGVRFP